MTPRKLVPHWSVAIVAGWSVVCAVSLTAGNAAAQLVTNQTFNSPPGGTSTTLSANSTALTGWTVDGTSEIPATNGIEFGTSFGVPGLASTQSVQLATGSFPTFKEGGIQQSIATIPGQVYNITIEAKEQRTGSTSGTVSFGGQTHTLSSLTTTFTGFSWTETATSSSTLFDFLGNSTALDAVIVSDLSLSLAQIPTVWSGSNSTDWGTLANWNNTSNIPSAAGIAVTFGTAGANSTVNIGTANRSAGVLTFLNSVPTTITGSGGNFLYLDDTGGPSASATVNVSGSHSISAPILLNSPAAFNVTAGTDQLIVSGVIGESSSSAAYGLSLSGGGTFTLAAANTFSGTTSVTSGTLLLTNSAALQYSTVAGGSVAFSPSVIPRAFTLGGLTANAGFSLADTSGDPISLSVGNNNATTTYSGTLSGSGSLTKIGSGMLTFSGATTFTGNTLVSNGTLVTGSATALQNSLLNPGGSGVFSFGTQSAVTLGGLTGNGNVNLLNANAQPVNLIVGNGTQNATFSGAISSGGTLTMNGAGTQVLSGNNSFGNTNVTAGTLQFQGANSLPAASPVGLGAAGVISIANDGSGSSGTINVGNNITLTAVGATTTIDARNNGSGNAGNTVAFGVLSNGTTGNAFNSTINFTGANGYLQSYTGLNLSGLTGQGTALNPTTTTVIINGPVTNQETGTTVSHFDTLTLGGTSLGNQILGVISDSYSFTTVGNGDTRVTKTGLSQWILAGQNTYSGPTTISGGTLQLGTGVNGQDGTFGSTNGVTNNAALVYNLFGSQIANYVISGSGSVAIIGPGDITLAASNSYTGPTVISSGTLGVAYGGSIAPSSTISIASGATFDASQLPSFALAGGQTLSGTGNYNVNGSLTAGAGTILPGAVASAGTLNVGTLSLNSGSVLKYDLGSNQDLINVSSGLTVNGGGIYLYQANGTSAFTTPGTYLLMNYGGFTGLPTNLSVLNPSASEAYTFTASGGSLDITITTPNTWTGGGKPSVLWSTPANWLTNQYPVSGNAVSFSGTVGLNNNNDLPGLSLAGILFNSSAGTFTLNGNSIQLAGPITNSSTAAQTINLNMTLVGGNVNVTAAAGNITLNGLIDDANQGYGITTGGTGTVILGGANTYSGTTSVTSGNLRLANSAAVASSTVNLGPSGVLSFAASNTAPVLGGLSGSGNISLATSSNQPVTLTVGNNNQNTTYSGVMSGPGSLIMQGYSTLTLAAPQSYNGATLINTGVLQLTPPPLTGSIGIRIQGSSTLTIAATGDGPAGAVMSNWNSATGGPPAANSLHTAAGVSTGASVSLSGTSGGGFGAETSGATDWLLSGYYYYGNTSGLITATITGIPFQKYSLYAFSADETANHQNALTMGGTTFYFSSTNASTFDQVTNTNSSLATTTTGNYAVVTGLTGANQTVTIYSAQDTGFSGFELVYTGSGSGGSLPATTPVTVSNGGTFDMTNCQQTIAALSSTDGVGSKVYLGNGALTVAGTSSTTFDGSISDGGAGGSLIVQGGRLTLTGNNSYFGATTVTGGTLQLTSGTNGQDGILSNTSGVNDNGTLLYSYSDNQSVAYSTGGIGSLVKAGPAMLTLTGNNSYSGTTSITGGTLQLGNGGGGYDGTIAGTRLVVDNAALVYDLTGSQAVAYPIRGSGDLVISSGTLALAGNDIYSGGTDVAGGMLILDDNSGLPSGSSLTIAAGATLEFDSTVAGSPVVAASVSAVPEPGTLVLLAAAVCSLAAFRRNRVKHEVAKDTKIGD